MSKQTIYLGLLCILYFPISSFAATKNVTITWSMPDASNVTGYRMYYAYDSSMSNKQFACATDDGKATALTCSNVEINQSPVYFEIAAVIADGELTSSPGSSSFTQSISPVQGFQLVMENASPPASSLSYRINFQPSSAPVPNGYLIDSGDSFNTDRGYGWISGPSSLGVRDRDNTNSPDQTYDTMIHVSPSSTWEISLPNGTYKVTVCNGDASFPTGIQNVQAEGQSIIENVAISTTSPWVEKTASITVSDKKLSIRFTGSSDPARLCWITITSAN